MRPDSACRPRGPSPLSAVLRLLRHAQARLPSRHLNFPVICRSCPKVGEPDRPGLGQIGQEMAVHTHGQKDLPFGRHPLVSTERDDEALQVISQSFTPARFAKIAEPQNFRLEMNGCRFGRLFFGFNRFGADTLVDLGRVEDALIIGFAQDDRRPSFFDLDGERVKSTTRTAVVISPGRRGRNWRPGPSGHLWASACRGAVLEERYQALVGRASMAGPLTFQPSVDLTQGPGRLLRDMLLALEREASVQDDGEADRLHGAFLEDAVISLLLTLPGHHNYRLAGRCASTRRLLLRAPGGGVHDGQFGRADHAGRLGVPLRLQPKLLDPGLSRQPRLFAHAVPRRPSIGPWPASD